MFGRFGQRSTVIPGSKFRAMLICTRRSAGNPSALAVSTTLRHRLLFHPTKLATSCIPAAWKPGIDILVPVPPSTNRAVQPVFVLADAIAQRLNVAVANCVIRTREIPQLKNVYKRRCPGPDRYHNKKGIPDRGRRC
jgi:predicted amidophosphoribosyltransferase